MTNLMKDWQQLAREASTENDPKKLMSLIGELTEALARERRNRRNARSPKVVSDQKTLDREVAVHCWAKPALDEEKRTLT